MTTSDIREEVRQRYARAATLASSGEVATAREHETASSSCSCGEIEQVGFGADLYSTAEEQGAPAAAVAASLGCGVPTAVADLHTGETVLDLGSGAGADVLITARRVGESGYVYGVDMTDEMLDLARRNAEAVGAGNVEFLKGYIEDIPLPDATVDVVISNCVINLSADKQSVFREMMRVLRPGGRIAYTDVLVDADIPDDARANMEQWTGCIAGALTRADVESMLSDQGFVDIQISETHRVHQNAGSAIVKARKPR